MVLNAYRRFCMLSLICAMSVYISGDLLAAPITGGTGPGGIETTAGGSGTNLKLWYRAEDLQDSGGNVAQWLDASGNNYTATAGTTAPTFNASGPNGLSVANFSGAVTGDQVLEVTSSAYGIAQNVQGVSMFTVVDHSQATVAGNQVYIAIGTGDTSHNFRSSLRALGNNQTVTVRRLDADGATHISGGAIPTTPRIMGGVIDYASGNGFGYSNGTQVGTSGSISSGSTENTPSQSINVGNINSTFGARQQFLGDMGEMIVFDRAVSFAERTIVDNYLSSKFNSGVVLTGADNQLATGDKYAGDTTANGNYDFHVFGVGQAATGGSQVLSSGASGFGIDLTGSTLAADNWVFAGRDSLDSTNSLVTTDLGSTGVEQRWEREWYVDVTGTFDATLAFNFADADLTPESLGSEFSLLYRAANNLDFTTVGSVASFDGDTILFQVNSASLVDGYYTLGFSVVPIPEPSSFLLLSLGVCFLSARRKRGGKK